MNKYKISVKKRFSNLVKKFISKIVLFFLYRGFKVLYKKDSRVKKELDDLEEGFVLELKACENRSKIVS